MDRPKKVRARLPPIWRTPDELRERGLTDQELGLAELRAVAEHGRDARDAVVRRLPGQTRHSLVAVADVRRRNIHCLPGVAERAGQTHAASRGVT